MLQCMKILHNFTFETKYAGKRCQTCRLIAANWKRYNRFCWNIFWVANWWCCHKYIRRGHYIKNDSNLLKKVILANQNDDIRTLNTWTLSLLEGNVRTYYSIDLAKPRGVDQSEEGVTLGYQTDYLNSLQFPKHKLEVKVGAVILLLQNLCINEGLCNGTRISSACIPTGDEEGEIVFIPRIKLDTGESSDLPFVLHRRQFPVTLAFTITINKSQGQSFPEVSLYLDKPLFSHGPNKSSTSGPPCWRRAGALRSR